ncbi:FAD-binding oxidoreductase [Kibdelosporangium phytohabitans]|nr:FAD-binding oxidoreductase [Kibdelosporangium phytohabitans]MBE1463468.1 FAD/FMN-containing dehydrogenase [Kibdelosporangium phytohabitans]
MLLRTTTDELVAALDGVAAGRVLVPSDPLYENALRLYTRSLRGRPDVVLQAASIDDVTLAVRTTASAGLPLSLRGGGHSGAGFAVADGGVMLDMSRLNRVRVDAGADRAHSEPGATWGDYDRATQRHGLASTGGVVSTTGVSGLTLGGGIGALRGLRGLSVDQLVRADVVLADGTLVTADEVRHPDLFWALRGGGGNFGVAVRLEFALYPVRRMVTGLLGWPLERASEVVGAFRRVADDLPDHIVCELVFTAPEGVPSILMTPRVIGTDSEPLLGPMRATGPTLDTVTEQSYVNGQRFMDPMAEWGMRHYWNTCTLRHIDDEVIATIARHSAGAPSPSSAIIVEHLHGAVSRLPAHATAVGFRHAPYNVFVEAKWTDQADDGVNRAWARQVVEALRPHSAGGAYVNYLPFDASSTDIAEAYGESNFARLRRVKSRYDPANLFRGNQNIPPM